MDWLGYKDSNLNYLLQRSVAVSRTGHLIRNQVSQQEINDDFHPRPDS